MGGGIIGLSLSIALRKLGAKVLIVERGEPGREASHAAAGMLVDCALETPEGLQPLATASARMYPEFVHELQDESGMNVDLRDQGTLLFLSSEHGGRLEAEEISAAQVARREPALAEIRRQAFFLKERSVDPRALTAAALKAAKHREVDISSGSTVQGLLLSGGRVEGVATDRTTYPAPVVVNCAGAWAGQISPHHFPTRPVKGQMLSVLGGPMLTHVVRTPEVYVVPRTDGRVLIGATVEESGYDKRTDPEAIQRMYHAAVALVPALAEARIHEAWAGLRPGTPDDLPILGATGTPGYFVATGHFRDGILLSPITAHVMAQVVSGGTSEFDLTRFSPARFSQ